MSNINDLVKQSAQSKPLTGLAARKAAAQANALATTGNVNVLKTATQMPDRIGIGFDDSGSMSSYNKIDDAHAGVEEFLRSCNKDTTSVCIYPFNEVPIQLSKELPAVALMVKKIAATNGTPLIEVTKKMLSENNLTHAIVFSDGQYFGEQDQLIKLAKDKSCSIDTVFIANANSTEENFKLQELAEATGGVYLRFEKGKSNFRTAFKYLAPTYRAMLMAPGFIDKVQNGEV